MTVREKRTRAGVVADVAVVTTAPGRGLQQNHPKGKYDPMQVDAQEVLQTNTDRPEASLLMRPSRQQCASSSRLAVPVLLIAL